MIEVRSTTAANIGGYMTWSNQLAGGVLLEAYSGEVMVESATIALGSGIGCRLSVQLAVADAAYDQRLINYTAEILKG
jgi:hypothetical protein